MALSPDAVTRTAAAMIKEHRTSLTRNGAKGRVRRYLEGDHDLPYMPRGAKAEFRSLAKKSVTNWLPLVSDTFSKALFVDGYRPAKDPENAAPWAFWQANGLDARQTIAHRGAIEYGQSFVLVLPGDPVPVITPLSPLRTHALYEDPDADFPTVALVAMGKEAGTDYPLWDLYDDANVYHLRESQKDAPEVVSSEAHDLGVVPFVRFRERLDGDAVGIISPLITIQDRVNETVFSLQIAIQYASFRQRWATGLAIPIDENAYLADGVTPNPNLGKPIEPFEAAINRLWVSDSPDTKFGDFAQTETRGHLEAYLAAVRSMAAIGQTPPHVLLGDLVNLSADALAAAEASTQRKVGEYETLFGEAWEQVLQLAAIADGGTADDDSAQVRWRDTEARSLAQTVDALGKIVQMLGVPAEGVWERIPGVTETDVERWKQLRQEGDVMGALLGDLARQQTPTATQAV